jgi:RimJ/RimL family protein N-acetyltransferase
VLFYLLGVRQSLEKYDIIGLVMNILESTNIDLIEPFPVNEGRRVFKWLHAYKNIVETDLSAKTPEDLEAFLTAVVQTPGVHSYGVIDKFNQLGFKHEAPLVGMIIYEPASIWNSYCHVASTRRAWGMGYIDEGIRASLDYLFSNEPQLLRVSALVLATNGPVKGLVRRLGARYEGCMKEMVTQNGQPKDLLHFGITKTEWVAKKQKTFVENKEVSNSAPLVVDIQDKKVSPIDVL